MKGVRMTLEYLRWQKESIDHALKTRRVVWLCGPRQSGKTTLIKQYANENTPYRTLDDPGLLKVALQDPLGFVKNPSGMMIIDEVQKAPDLIPSIKMAVDDNNRPGQFLLTGSANFHNLPTVTESLAGRISTIRLRALSQSEILGKQSVFLKKAFNRDWPSQIKGYDKHAAIQVCFRGGFPECLSLPPKDRRAWHTDYANTLLERDLKDLANIRRKATMRKILDALMSWSGKFMDVAGFCGQLGITKGIFETYTNLLETIYLFERVPAWIATDYDRVGKRDKIFTTDTGLMASLLNWRPEEVFLDSDRSGKIIETLVFNELSGQIDLDRGYRLSQYRDRLNHEIDFIIENERGALLGIEVKAGSAVSKDDAKHLAWFKRNLAAKKEFIGLVIYTGEHVLPLGENITGLPIAALWS
jgi:predicted AAA+ superfamily ATPase